MVCFEFWGDFFFLGWGGVKLNPRDTFVIIWHIVPARMTDKCGDIGGIRVSRWNWRNPAPLLLRAPQTPQDVAWVWNRATTAGRQRLTAWAVTRLEFLVTFISVKWKMLPEHLMHITYIVFETMVMKGSGDSFGSVTCKESSRQNCVLLESENTKVRPK
jgi:hypothetical protein